MLFLHLISRKHAKQVGSTYYFTGNPCPKGHVDLRRVINCACLRCHANEEAERNKDYISRNKERIAANGKRYYAENREKIDAYKREYISKNREKVDAYQKAYREQNREKNLLKMREWYAKNSAKQIAGKKAKRAADPEAARAKDRAWHAANPDNRRAKNMRSKTARRTRLVEFDTELTKFVEQEAAELCRLRGESTGVSWQIDHIIPLCAKTVSGLHYWANLQVIPATLNCSKRHKLMYLTFSEWIAEL